MHELFAKAFTCRLALPAVNEYFKRYMSRADYL